MIPQEMYAGYQMFFLFLLTASIPALEALNVACDEDDGAKSNTNFRPTASLQDSQVNRQNLSLNPQILHARAVHSTRETRLVCSPNQRMLWSLSMILTETVAVP
jgi:hypothetical protein